MSSKIVIVSCLHINRGNVGSLLVDTMKLFTGFLLVVFSGQVLCSPYNKEDDCDDIRAKLIVIHIPPKPTDCPRKSLPKLEALLAPDERSRSPNQGRPAGDDSDFDDAILTALRKGKTLQEKIDGVQRVLDKYSDKPKIEDRALSDPQAPWEERTLDDPRKETDPTPKADPPPVQPSPSNNSTSEMKLRELEAIIKELLRSSTTSLDRPQSPSSPEISSRFDAPSPPQRKWPEELEDPMEHIRFSKPKKRFPKTQMRAEKN